MPTLVHEIASPVAATLILIPHDWSDGFTLTARFSTQVVEARTGIESRAPEFAIPRHKARMRYLMNDEEAEELRLRLMTLRGTRLALPLPMDATENGSGFDDFKILDGPTITFDASAGTYTIGEGLEANKSTLIFGKMIGDATVSPVNGKSSAISFEIFEDSPESLALTYNDLAGESESLPDPDWSEPIREVYRSQVKHEDIGNGRESITRGDEAWIKFGQRGGFKMDRSELRSFLRFWADKRGSWSSFVMPEWYEPGDPANRTMRFFSETLTIDFRSQGVAEAVVEFSEELDTIDGVPSQAAPARAWMYKLQWRDALAVQRWTSWESSLSFDSQTWLPQKISHQNFKQTLSTKGDSIEIECANYSGCPFLAFVLFEVERELLVTVYECDPDNSADAVQIFSGSVTKVKNRDGAFVAECQPLGGLLDRKTNSFLSQRVCNYTLFDSRCGVDESAYQVTGTVAAISGVEIDVTCGATDVADYFAFGWAIIGTGDTAERRSIVRSEPISGGQRITIHRPIKQTGTPAVTFTPGCSGEWGEGGCAKFGNQEEFGGAPRQPSYIDQVTTGYKQKVGK